MSKDLQEVKPVTWTGETGSPSVEVLDLECACCVGGTAGGQDGRGGATAARGGGGGGEAHGVRGQGTADVRPCSSIVWLLP